MIMTENFWNTKRKEECKYKAVEVQYRNVTRGGAAAPSKRPFEGAEAAIMKICSYATHR